MLEVAGIITKFNQFKQAALNLERQGLQFDLDIEIDSLEITSL
jgi:hypothetical protein